MTSEKLTHPRGGLPASHAWLNMHAPQNVYAAGVYVIATYTVAILAQGTHWAVAATQAFFPPRDAQNHRMRKEKMDASNPRANARQGENKAQKRTPPTDAQRPAKLRPGSPNWWQTCHLRKTHAQLGSEPAKPQANATNSQNMHFGATGPPSAKRDLPRARNTEVERIHTPRPPAHANAPRAPAQSLSPSLASVCLPQHPLCSRKEGTPGFEPGTC